jgi:8-oxo-dGTP pyrophosphatase MutT (NUDIX family)
MALARLRSVLASSTAAGLRGDWEVTDDAAPEAGRVLMPAAVLIAVSNEPEPQLLLTRRSDKLTRHAGQIAFPGGRIDPEDDGPVAAALREAEEEVALGRHLVDVLGTLSPYETGTGFSIRPVVGIIPPGLALTPHEREVAEVFHVPFAHVLDPANHQRRSGEWQGRTRHFYVIPYEGREIWGATAAMLVNLARTLG